MDTEYFSNVNEGNAFISFYEDENGGYSVGWFAKLIVPTDGYNAVNLDNGNKIYFVEEYPVVVES